MGSIGNRMEELELIALGRIPRCTGCPRYAALLAMHAGEHEGHAGLPEVPLFCSHQVCAPLAIRLSVSTETCDQVPRDLPLAG